MARDVKAWACVLLVAAGIGGCGFQPRPKWIRDPEGRKWDESRQPYLGDSRAAAEPSRPGVSTTPHA